MGAKDELEVKVRARLTNVDETIKELTDKYEKGLIDASANAFRQIGAKRNTVETRLNAGDIEGAARDAQKLNNLLLRLFETINVNAGGAASSLAKLESEMTQLKERERQILKNDPDNKFRTDDQGKLHYYKSAVNREAIGMPDPTGKATFKRGRSTLSIDYGGSNWSNTNAMHGIVRTLNDAKTDLSKWLQPLKEALAALGYVLKGTTKGQFSAELDSKRLQREYDAETQAHKADLAEVRAKIAEVADEIKAERLVVDNVTIVGDDGEKLNIGARQTESIESNKELGKGLENLTDEEKELAKAQKEQEAAADDANKALDQQKGIVGKAAAAFFSYHIILRQLRRLWNDAVRTVRELDTQLTNQAIVTDLTRQSAWGLVQTYQELGRATGFTTTQIAEVNTEYLRQGNSLKDALVLTEAAAKAARVAGIDARQSVEYLTTAIHGFRLKAEDALEVSDKFAALAADSASNYEDLAIALSKVASQAALAGMSMDYTLALLTTGLDVTQEAPESIGTALKTVIARMREISNYGETLEDGVDINQVEEALKYVNIQLRDQNGELRSTQDVLDELGRKWDTLSANQQAATAKALAGTRQQSRLVAILDNYENVIKYQQEAELSVGATNAQMQEYLEGMDAAMNRLHVAYEAFITSITDNNVIMWFVDKLTEFITWFTDFLSHATGKIAIISSVVALFTTTLLPKILATVKAWLKNLTQREAIEKRIDAIYQSQYDKILAINREEGKGGEQRAANMGINPNNVSGSESGQTTSKGAKASAIASGISAAISGTATLVTMIVQAVKAVQNYPKELASKAIERAQELQGKIYDNRKTKNTLASLTDSLQELDKHVIKTADDLKEMSKTREDLIATLAGEGSDTLYQNMSTQALIDASLAQQAQLDDENKKLISDLSKTLLGAEQYNTNWGNVGAKIAGGAAAGLVAGGGVGTVLTASGIGAIAAPIALAVGAGVGAIVGGITAWVEEANKARIAQENQKKVHELLQSDEGVQQVQTLLAYQYDDQIDTITTAGKKLSDSLKSTYSTIVAALDGEDLERLLKKYNYNSQALADSILNATKAAGNSIVALNDTTSTYAERIKAVQAIYKAYSAIDREVAELFKKQYQTYFDIYEQIGDLGVKYLDALKLNLSDTSDLLATLQQMQDEGTITSFQEEFYNLMAAMSDGSHTVTDLEQATEGWSVEAVRAAARLIAAGNTLDSVAASITSANSNVANIRDTQSKWGTMSATERQQWLSQNSMFFQNADGEFDRNIWEAFYTGGDITPYIEEYKRKTAEQARANAKSLLESATLLRDQAAKELAQEQAKLAAMSETDEEYQVQLRLVQELTNKVAAYESEMVGAELQMQEAAEIGTLSLQQIVDKQSQQLDKLREMYKAEEEELTKSLQKRKEAYEKYFDSVSRSESVAEYEQTRNQLISSISRLGGGVDAASHTRVAELRNQLMKMEQEQAKQRREDARQAVLDNIDSQIDAISDHFEELLDSNQKLLESMDENTHMQYLMYLAQSGATVEEQQLATQQLADLLQGRWGVNGLGAFNAPTISNIETNSSSNTMNLVINGRNETVSMTHTQMQQFIKKMLDELSSITGISLANY